ncbi:unnamed protein product [Caenorhabditis angaria]|uniref:Rab proteins geranylgeranyltransferase component A n=1 Tax=Caenorhabditis angaria TaxID=860376 RepID=A0A9P1N017_9PELO|nr:unnamed protein product [Caenorhabditis angaria]
MDEKLPEHVDVIVLGTGLPEAILASACSRSGLSVLHLDRNEYYGAEWSSFNLTSIKEFLQEDQNLPTTSQDLLEKLKTSPEENIVLLGNREIIGEKKAEWIREEFEEQLKDRYRRFSIDVLPKVLLSRGAMVQTLCDSQVSQYAEFKLVDRQLCPVLNEGKIELNQVPCSKGEIFTSPVLTMMEKRGLMKFITFCTQWKLKQGEETKNEQGKEILGEYAEKSFDEFLKSMGIDETLRNFIINTIGILETNPNTFEGMKACCDFMDSVGHFGPSPFLFPLYGCGELSQCFCRLAAVFGSLYCLGRPVQALVYDKQNRVCAVIADNQRINCDRIIMSAKYVPEIYKPGKSENIERICYITDKSILKGEKEHISLINIASLRANSQISRIIEAGFEVFTAPKGFYLVHATGSSEDSTSNLEDLLLKIFEQNEIEPIWRLKFDIKSLSFDEKNIEFPENLTISPNCDAFIHYSKVIDQCREIFCGIWPDRDFLPRSIKKEEEEAEEEAEDETENIE